MKRKKFTNNITISFADLGNGAEYNFRSHFSSPFFNIILVRGFQNNFLKYVIVCIIFAFFRGKLCCPLTRECFSFEPNIEFEEEK